MEIINVTAQTVAPNQNVLFSDSVTCGSCSTSWRVGSGLVVLRGLTQQCRARYRVTFGANVAIPTGVDVGPVSLAIALDGEPLPSTAMIVTPAAVDEYNNVFSSVFIDVPKGCCLTASVENTTATNISVENANLIVERVA